MKDRVVNIDLLKILVILMVISLHFLSHQNYLHSYDFGSAMYFLAWIIYSFCICSVDVFVIITGFFLSTNVYSSEKHLNRLIKILLCTQIISVIVGIFCVVIFNEKVSTTDMIRTVFPTFTNTNWFITSYFLLILISPFLNKLMCVLGQKTLRNFLILLFFGLCFFPTVSFQYRIVTKTVPGVAILFALLYMIGGYIRKYNINVKRALLIFVSLCFLIFLSKVFLDILILNFPFISNKLGVELVSKYSDKFFEYSSFLVVLAALALFLCFKNLTLNFNFKINKYISELAACSLTVYIFHDQQILRKSILWDKIVNIDLLIRGQFEILLLPLAVVLTSICIYLISYMLHIIFVKQIVYNKLLNLNIIKNLEKRFINCSLYKKYEKFINAI